MRCIYQLHWKVWLSASMLNDWNLSVIYSIHNKGDLTAFPNYHDISTDGLRLISMVLHQANPSLTRHSPCAQYWKSPQKKRIGVTGYLFPSIAFSLHRLLHEYGLLLKPLVSRHNFHRTLECYPFWPALHTQAVWHIFSFVCKYDPPSASLFSRHCSLSLFIVSVLFWRCRKPIKGGLRYFSANFNVI